MVGDGDDPLDILKAVQAALAEEPVPDSSSRSGRVQAELR